MHNLFFSLFLFFTTTIFADITAPTRDPFFLPINNTVTIVQPAPKLFSCWIPVYFAKAGNIASFLTTPQINILSPLGKIHADTATNQLWIKDDVHHLVKIRALVHHLDQSGPQFLIKAKIMTIDKQYQKTLGALFQTDNQNNSNSLSPLSMSEPNMQSAAGEFTVTLATLPGNHLLDMQISALEQEGHATLISDPALMTLNNQPAMIESGAEVPYQEATSSGATSVSFKKAVLRLQVTPVQLPHHRILLHIELNQDKVSELTVNGVPAIQTQHITTQVIVHNNQTIVLGGILESSRSMQNAGIPVLDHVPIVGNLFQHHVKQMKQQELMIFITPRNMHEITFTTDAQEKGNSPYAAAID